MIDRLERWWRSTRIAADRHRHSGRRRNLADQPAPQGPGLLLIQVDGLGAEVFRHALAAGMVPNVERLGEKEPYRLADVYAGVPSSTPAFQAELFYGAAGAVPAYSFVHRRTGRVFRMSDREAAATVESQIRGRGLLDGGSSYSNIYKGGASVVRFSMATLGWADLLRPARPRDLPLVVLAHGWDLVRTVVASVREIILGLPDLIVAVRAGEDLRTEIHFLQSRVGVAVVLREALATLAAVDLARGSPVVHLDLLGYDEWAHRRGPGSPESLRALRDIDRVIGRLSRAARRRDRRDYDVWVFSDHGQEPTQSYVETQGRTVAEAIGAVLGARGIDHDVEAEPQRGVQGQRAGSLIGYRVAEALVPGLELAPKQWSGTRALTTALGPLGHVYLPDPVEPSTRVELAEAVVADADVPMVLTTDGTSTLAVTDTGRHHLPDDAAAVLGADHPHLDAAAADLAAVVHHPDAGELVLSGWRLDGPAVSFPHENGSHAGPGPNETSAFVWAPADAPIDWDTSPALRANDLRQAALSVLEGTGHRPAVRWTREADGTTLRVVTYNIHSGIGLDGVASPERIARVLARMEPDVVALQEVDVGLDRTGGVDQARVIADQLGMELVFHATNTTGGGQFGDAVLSRLPMRVVRTGPLPRWPGEHDLEPRGAIWVEVDAGQATFQVINTHLSIHPRERRLQADALLGPDWLGSIDAGTNVVLLGDFNAGPGLPTCRAIGERLIDAQVGLDGHRPRRTWGGRWPVARIDHVFVDPGLVVLHVDVPRSHLTSTASDHLPLQVDLRAEAQAPLS